MRGQFQFHGKGGELFLIFLVNLLLSVITLGIYIPWAIVKIVKYMAGKTSLDGIEFSFEGSGGDLLSLYLVNYILTAITLGIYGPIANLKITEYYTKNLVYKGKNFQFDTSNLCDFWCLIFIQGILCAITLGIYTPWAMVKIRRNILERTSYDGEKFGFTAEGGELFSLYLIQGILTIITLGIYSPWAVAKIANYIMNNTTYGENGKFALELEGGELFSIIILHGIILTVITLGIYCPWYVVKFTEYEYSKMQIIDA
ncbi:MAG: DUF898 domain-containing protein [Candidatus Cloacimonetes bacterium]|nr:DUF898 domain-containing protein [Candidatus Cloacimonadota bacterium]